MLENLDVKRAGERVTHYFGELRWLVSTQQSLELYPIV